MVLGAGKKDAVEEARRCLQCANPVCVPACPLGIDIPGFIRAIRENETDKALSLIRQKNVFASICGRICPAPCEKACVLEEEGVTIGIRALERFVADTGREKAAASVAPTGKKVAVVGSGPAGMAAAAELAGQGFSVTVFESGPFAGGALAAYIPEFRLPRKTLTKEWDILKKLGVEVKTSVGLGTSMTFESLQAEGFNAVLLAVGAGSVKIASLPGVNLGGVFFAAEFLQRINFLQTTRSLGKEPLPFGKKLVIIGSGADALDCGRVAVRLGASATVIFEHTEDEIPVRAAEVQQAREEGVAVEPLARVTELLGDARGFVRAVRCFRMDFADPASTGQWKLLPVAGSEFEVPADTALVSSVGGSHAWLGRILPKLHVASDGTIRTNELTGMTSVAGVFAVEPAKAGEPSATRAFAAGRRAAQNVVRFFQT